MTREEVKAEINKVFEPAFANYIITALTEESTPSERKTGKWIFGETMGHSWMKCSECCKSQDGQTLCFTYCPNCGAKMEGAENE